MKPISWLVLAVTLCIASCSQRSDGPAADMVEAHELSRAERLGLPSSCEKDGVGRETWSPPPPRKIETSVRDGRVGVSLAIGQVATAPGPEIVAGFAFSNNPELPAPLQALVLASDSPESDAGILAEASLGRGVSALVLEVNGDDFLDITNGTSLLYGGSDAEIETADVPGSRTTRLYVWGDIDGNGDADLLAIGVSTFEYFASPEAQTPTQTTKHAHEKIQNNLFYRILDITGDSFGDLILIGRENDNVRESSGVATVTLLAGDGQGSFSDVTSVLTFPGGVSVEGVAFGDFNCDGKYDLVSTHPYGAEGLDRGMQVWLGDGDGWNGEPVMLEVGPQDPRDGGTIRTSIGDFNGDGKHDIVAASIWGTVPGELEGQLEVRLGRGDGTFAEAVLLEGAPELPGVVAAGDLDSNGSDEVVAMALEDGETIVVWGME